MFCLKCVIVLFKYTIRKPSGTKRYKTAVEKIVFSCKNKTHDVFSSFISKHLNYRCTLEMSHYVYPQCMF